MDWSLPEAARRTNMFSVILNIVMVLPADRGQTSPARRS
jgi:hypothetical protein